MLKKIVVIGPESTGKSTLCTQLAAHYNAPFCIEYARPYLLQHGTNYSFDDLLTIAKGQLALEDAYQPQPTNTNQLLLVDTDMYVMKVWCEYVFGKCHQYILNQIVARPYHLYLLCTPDVPWVKDELREYPDLENREKLFHIYKDLLINQNIPWVQIKGNYPQRLQIAINAINKTLLNK
jgi:NadR type nicotinamide-nucleotide adenylyltransferase